MNTRQRAVNAGLGFVLGLLTVALDRRAWLVMPAVVFVLLIVLMLLFPRRRITPGWVALAAAAAIAVGAILKFI